MTRTTTEEALEIIREMPGVTSGNIVELMPHANQQTVYSTLNAQYIRGNLTRVTGPSDGKGWVPYQWSIAPAGTKPPVVVRKGKQKVSAPKPTGDAPVLMFQTELEELRRWKAEAIARYPDLAVDPIILKARGIVAAEMDGVDDDYAAAVRAGKRDGVLAMRLVVKMLEGAV